MLLVCGVVLLVAGCVVVGLVEVLSLRMFLRIKNPTTTAAMAMTIASVEPIGDALLPDFRGRLGCSLLMCLPQVPLD